MVYQIGLIKYSNCPSITDISLDRFQCSNLLLVLGPSWSWSYGSCPSITDISLDRFQCSNLLLVLGPSWSWSYGSCPSITDISLDRFQCSNLLLVLGPSWSWSYGSCPSITDISLDRFQCSNLLLVLGPSWSWSYGSWNYNYLCNQCLSPLKLWVRISIRARCTTLCDKVCQWLVTGWWFSLGSPVSFTNKTDHHDITEILLKVVLNAIKQTNKLLVIYLCGLCFGLLQGLNQF